MNKNKIDAEKLFCKILQTEINNEIDKEMIKGIKDPNYKPDITPVIFHSKEDEEAYIRMVKRNLEG